MQVIQRLIGSPPARRDTVGTASGYTDYNRRIFFLCLDVSVEFERSLLPQHRERVHSCSFGDAGGNRRSGSRCDLYNGSFRWDPLLVQDEQHVMPWRADIAIRW